MTGRTLQSTYQVRLGWGADGLEQLAEAPVVVIVDAIGDGGSLAATAATAPHAPVVFVASLRTATATAQAAYDVQVASGARTAINLVLAGEDGRFAVEDYLAAGAIADALTALGIDHSSPDVAVAAEGFRALRRGVKHLVSASAAGTALSASGRRDELLAAATLDAEADAVRIRA